MSLFEKVSGLVEGASAQEIVETLATVLYRNAAVTNDASNVKSADYLRAVADNIGSGNLSIVVAGASNKKAVTSAANGRKGGRPKGSKNKVVEAAVETA